MKKVLICLLTMTLLILLLAACGEVGNTTSPDGTTKKVRPSLPPKTETTSSDTTKPEEKEETPTDPYEKLIFDFGKDERVTDEDGVKAMLDRFEQTAEVYPELLITVGFASDFEGSAEYQEYLQGDVTATGRYYARVFEENKGLLSSLDAVWVSHIGYTPWVRVRISVDKLTCEALLQLSSNTAIRSIRVGYPPVISPNA